MTIRERTIRSARLLVLASLPGLLCGCQGALSGRWHLVECAPNRETFAIDNVDFQRDGTYSATTTLDGVTVAERGTFEFNGFKLMLRPQAGGQHTYNALLRLSTLELTDGKRRVMLQKGPKG